MMTEATTSVRARSADGRFVSKATGAAVVAPTAVAVPENMPDPNKSVKKADSKKADSKKHAKKADSKKTAKKTDSKNAKSKSGKKNKKK